MNISWSEDLNALSKTYTASIKIDVQDKIGMLKEILTNLTECNTNVTYANIKAHTENKIGTIYLGVEVDNIDRLRKVINSLQSIPEVYSVKRVSANNGHKVNDLNNHHNKKRKKENNKK